MGERWGLERATRGTAWHATGLNNFSPRRSSSSRKNPRRRSLCSICCQSPTHQQPPVTPVPFSDGQSSAGSFLLLRVAVRQRHNHLPVPFFFPVRFMLMLFSDSRSVRIRFWQYLLLPRDQRYSGTFSCPPTNSQQLRRFLFLPAIAIAILLLFRWVSVPFPVGFVQSARVMVMYTVAFISLVSRWLGVCVCFP